MKRPRGPKRQKPVGIIDIGSNSIRLVVYDGLSRTPVPMFNEKAICALGAGVGATGRLNPDGMESAVYAIGRFVRLARAMEVERLDILATAAVRDAVDGKAFISDVERLYDIKIDILSGGQEATLAALGVLCGLPDASGLVADLGGGSLELAEVAGAKVGRHATLPLGVLRTSDASEGDAEKAALFVERHLAEIGWLSEMEGQALYAVGGSWRAIARICIAQIDHPLLVLDNFALDAEDARRLVGLISKQSRKSLEKTPGVAKKRAPTLPLAALILHRLIEVAKPRQIIFSIFGMREGQFFKQLPEKVQGLDPLLAECAQMADLAGRFPAHAVELMEWMAPLFANESPERLRLRHAACLIGDIFWGEHPDYRAEQAFLKVLRLPFLGVDHKDRAALALSIHARYKSDEDNPLTARTRMLIDDTAADHARLVGLALRMGHSISGGAPDVLRATRLAIEENTLVLMVPAGDPAFHGDMGDRSFDRVARAVNCENLLIRKIA